VRTAAPLLRKVVRLIYFAPLISEGTGTAYCRRVEVRLHPETTFCSCNAGGLDTSDLTEIARVCADMLQARHA
jgi:hypothetical protein